MPREIPPNEEYIIKVTTTAGVLPQLVDTIRTCAQLIHDVAANEGKLCEVEAGYVNHEVTYTPSPSMYAHVPIAHLDNAAVVAHRPKDDTIYVKE